MSVTSGVLTMYGRELLASSLFSDGVALPSLWIGLLLQAPDINDTGTTVSEVAVEVVDPVTLVASATGYSRVLVPSSDSATSQGLWVQLGGGVLSYSQSLRFGEAQSDWGFVVSWGMFTESTGGQLIAAGPAGFDVLGPGLPENEEDTPTGDVVVIGEYGIKLGVIGG